MKTRAHVFRLVFVYKVMKCNLQRIRFCGKQILIEQWQQESEIESEIGTIHNK